MVTVVTASDLVNVNQLNFIASQEDEAKVRNLLQQGDGGCDDEDDDDDDDDEVDNDSCGDGGVSVFGRCGVRNYFLCLLTC